MSNPIFTSDLLGADEIKKMIQHFTELGKAAEDSIARIRKEAATLEASLKGVNVTQAEQREQIKDTAKSAAKLEKELDKYNGLLQDNAVKLAGVKNAQRQLNQLNKLEAKLLASKKGSYNALSAQYSINKIKLNQMSAEERKATQAGRELEENTREIYEEMKRLQEATGKHALSVGDYGKAFDGLKQPIQGAIAQLRAFIANPIGAVIAAIAGAFMLMKNAITRSEAGQDRLNKVMRVAGAVLEVVMSIVTDLAVALFDAIPAAVRKAGNKISEFAKKTKAGFLELRIGIANMLGQAEKVDTLTQELVKVNSEVVGLQRENEKLDKIMSSAFSNAIDGAKNFGKNLQDNIRNSALLADLEAARNKEERRVLVANARLAKQAAELKAAAEETKKTAADQSIEALQKAFQIEEKALQNELRLERIRLDIAKRESALGKDNIEAKKAIAEQQAAVINAEAALLQQQRTNERELQEFRSEAFAQETERQKNRLEILKTNNNIEAIELQRIVEDEKRSVDERIAAIEQLTAKRVEEARKGFEIERQILEARLRAQKISIEDYNIAIQLLDAKKAEALKQSTDDEIKALEGLGNSIKSELVEPLTTLPTLSDLSFGRAIEDQAAKARAALDVQGNERKKNIFDFLGIDFEDQEGFKQSMVTALNFAKQQLNSFLQERIRIADQMVAQSDREVEAANQTVQNAQSALQAEIARSEQGLANRMDTAEEELRIAQQQAAQAKAQQDKALRQQKQAHEAQQRMQSIQQASNLITASAKIWAQFGNPLFALPAIGIMWASFAAAKLQAAKLSKREFAEGGLEILGGGSHASGRDTYLGFQSEGKPAYGERGEAVAIISKRNTRKYKDILPALVRSLNTGTFENHFQSVQRTADQIPLLAVNNETVNTSIMEEHLKAIRDQNGHRYHTDGKGNVIEYYKNLKTIHA